MPATAPPVAGVLGRRGGKDGSAALAVTVAELSDKSHIGAELYEIVADAQINGDLKDTEAKWAPAKAEATQYLAGVARQASSPSMTR